LGIRLIAVAVGILCTRFCWNWCEVCWVITHCPHSASDWKPIWSHFRDIFL